MSLALNGVVTQEPKSQWESAFGVSTRTDNDAEIIHQMLLSGKNIFSLRQASLAGCALWVDGAITAFRNGKRPLWSARGESYSLVASTRYMLSRALIADPIENIKPGVIQELIDGSIYTHTDGIEDLQLCYTK